MIPRVSICIPVYRQAAFAARAIASVFSQSLQEFEVLITDDSENNEVFNALSEWISDPRLIYHKNTNRLGSPENWNASMQLARSDLIKFLHHDDWFATTDALERFVHIMETNPKISFAFSSTNACEDDGRLIFVHKPTPGQIELLRERPWELQFANFVGAPSATIFRRRPGFQFDSGLHWVVDIDAYLKILGTQPHFEFISDALVCIAANGAHQVTRSFVADSVSRTLEHLSLYTSQRPPNLQGRIKGIKFIFYLLAPMHRTELAKINIKRSVTRRSTEEKMLLFAIRFKKKCATTIKSALHILKNRFFELSHAESVSYSQCGEDRIVDFLSIWLGYKQINYLDIGAHHPTWLSNTYYFYRKGFRGVLIEPDADLCKGLYNKRPCDKVLNLAVGTDGDEIISIYVMTSRTLNTLDKAQAEALQAAGRERIEEVRKVRRLGVNKILAEHFESGAPDFVSLDIEGLDLAILQAWDFDQFRPKIFCVETLTYTQDNSERKLTEIIDFMISKHYKVYADTFVNTIFVCQEAWQRRPVYA